ncbi:MAG: periplasmic sensor signal transduction histidine kinase [Bradyrhizobium sp.]|nr:periplasmic sensor signal transduction histidine kinase [Bradyrhizobium sp.]
MKSLSLKTKAAFAVTGLLLVVLGVICAIQLQLVKADMLRVLQANQLTTATRAAEEIDDKLQISLTALTKLAESIHPATDADWTSLQTMLENRPVARSFFDTMTIVAADGLVVARVPASTSVETINVADRAWFKDLMAGGAPSISDPVKSRLHGDPVVVIAASLRDPDGTIVATISGALNLYKPNFIGHIGMAKIGNTGSFGLVGRDRTIIMARDKKRVMTQGPAPGFSPFFDRAVSGGEGVGESTNRDGVVSLYAYKPLQSVPWVLTARLPVEEAFAPIARAQAHFVLLIAAAALMAMPLVWLVMWRLLVPLQRLHQGVRANRANAGAATEVDVSSTDEIGELALEFNALIRERAQADVLVRERASELEQSNEELKAFSYSVSHDLRSPLRSMNGFAMVLAEDYADKLDEEGRDAIDRIRGASQRMGSLIDDLLRLSHVSRAELSVARVDLSAMAGEIADTIDQANLARTVEWAIEPGLGIHADAALMRIAMQNLMQNAWKFTTRAARPVIRVGVLQGAGRPAYFVADNGVGFDVAYADKLFSPFQRLHHADDFAGTGIGLAIVQRIIHRHGGSIRAEAKQNEGATFFFSVKEPENGTDEQDHPAG